jgi:hypothetical protein
MPTGEERRGAVCGRTACTVRCRRREETRPVGSAVQLRRLPPTLPRPSDGRPPAPRQEHNASRQRSAAVRSAGASPTQSAQLRCAARVAMKRGASGKQVCALVRDTTRGQELFCIYMAKERLRPTRGTCSSTGIEVAGGFDWLVAGRRANPSCLAHSGRLGHVRAGSGQRVLEVLAG